MNRFSRRSLLQASAAVLGASRLQAEGVPWYRRTLRWGQTNLSEKDPEQYDAAFWRSYWRETAIQGVIVNAGGIVAYYPSRVLFHYQAAYLGGHDLYGEIARAAHKDGLAVLARMDSNRATAEFYQAHPDWFAVDSAGKPYREGDRYIACIHGPYYEEFIPAVLKEIIERSHPEGFADNSWSGLPRRSICHCANCSRKFRDKTGFGLPAGKDWADPAYRAWIRWNYDRRLEVWDLNNRVTKQAGGPDCIWIGMNSGSVSSQSGSFRDVREICRRAEMLLLDHQRRDDDWGFAGNIDAGKRMHGVLGWDKLAPESMAMYQSGPDSFRLAAKPASEARMWMFAGFAGGIQPWWHHIGARHEDRRAYATAPPVMRWHRDNERYLANRRPVATVGLAWSQVNADFFGRDDPGERVDAPYRGFAEALIRARIPYVPIHLDDLDRNTEGLAAIVLPNIGAMSDSQCAAVQRFSERGGAVLATGVTGLYDDTGAARPEFGLASVLGVKRNPEFRAGEDAERRRAVSHHTYLRLPAGAKARHEALSGFDGTEILAFGGLLDALETVPDASVLLTYIPPFPVYPPEFAYMREERTSVPGLVVRERPGAGRVAFLAADLDRRFARDHLPDHACLLANLVRWCAKDRIPLRVEGSGLVDCELYLQESRLILHIVNLTNEAAWRQPLTELTPTGPLQVGVRSTGAVKGAVVRQLVAGGSLKGESKGAWVSFEVPRVIDHEVLVIE